MSDAPTLEQSFAVLAGFLQDRPLTGTIAELEYALDGASAERATSLLTEIGVGRDLFAAAVATRKEVGRLNDLIHAVGIGLALPHLLDEDEVIVNRPSLAAGNDPTRPFDLETDRRVAEFKFSAWKGADAMRKRNTFKDFVHLAADRSERIGYLYVLGDSPLRFLRSTRSTAAWGLDRAPATRELFADRFGDLDTPISTFVASQADRVQIVNLQEAVPELFD